MNKLFISTITILIHILGFSQSFAPAAGQPGSTAIHKDSSIFVGWATECNVTRGYLNIEEPELGFATHGEESFALGPASGISTDCISLGDGGIATVTFSTGIRNGDGPDFAIFENGVTDGFLELAFVEVSSDGSRFVRFPAVSEIAPAPQLGSFGIVDCRYIHNFAGKYRLGYGTPFDLEDLIDSVAIDLENISHVRLVDVVGSTNPTYATYDSKGNIVNNLHPTPFESGGFDLEAVGVIHGGSLAIEKVVYDSFAVYPNPCSGILTIKSDEEQTIQIFTLLGELIMESKINNLHHHIDISRYNDGCYIISNNKGFSQLIQLIK